MDIEITALRPREREKEQGQKKKAVDLTVADLIIFKLGRI